MNRKLSAVVLVPLLLVACSKAEEQPPVVTIYETETIMQPAPADTSRAPSPSTAATSAVAAAPKNKIIPVEALETLWVPSLCGNQAANLVNGELPASARTVSNYAQLARDESGAPKGAYTDINGDGRDEAVIVYNCDGGGAAGWPDNLLIYDNDLNYLTDFTGWKDVSGYSPARHHIQAFQWDEDSIRVQWLGYAEKDAACCASRKLLGELTMPGGVPTMTLITDVPVTR
ncbi:hypothetical protein CKALI_03925 [Corynebacterium kalinowskii]|uniref:Secreted protein n=1 Tax=Corynebacterium kalinowskii TaxID=2675216 RepID=A0A6B8VJM1_9CORY|nr:hypothetical protein [Corynebacterium kalinowskii]QGU01664.1 hypothetical protein CKALI_03925 [Corynebacterium kalinowskii]